MLKTWGWSIQRFALPALSEPINCRYRDSIMLQRFYACRSVCIDHTTKSCVGCIVKKVAHMMLLIPSDVDPHVQWETITYVGVGQDCHHDCHQSAAKCDTGRSHYWGGRGGCKEPLYYSLSDLSNVESFFHSIVVFLVSSFITLTPWP